MNHDKVIALENPAERKDRQWREGQANRMRNLANRMVAGDERLDSLVVVWSDESGIHSSWMAGKLSLALFALDVAKQDHIRRFIDGELD